MKPSLHEKRLLVTFRRNKNLRDLLVNSSLLPPTQTKGCHPCGKPRCETCSHIVNFNTVKSTSTNRILRMATSSTCLSTGIVYLIQCARCRIQYVGQSSNSIHVRFQQHMRYVKLRDEYKPISTHYNSPGHSIRDSKVLALDCSKNLNARLRLEDTWITCLGSLQPAGLNQRYQTIQGAGTYRTGDLPRVSTILQNCQI